MRSHSISSSILESRIQINVQSENVESTSLELTYLPPVYIDDKEVTFLTSQNQAAPSTTLEVYGLPFVLERLTVRCL